MRLTCILVFVGSLCATTLGAQESLNLEETVAMAVDRSFVVEQGRLQLRGDQVSLRTNKLTRYPSLSLAGGGFYQFGRTIDPVTNDFVSESIGTNTFNASANVPLYSGGRVNRSIARDKVRIAASEANIEATKQDVALQAASLYLEVLLAGEQVRLSSTNLSQANQQLIRTRGLVLAGQLAPADSFEVASSRARQLQLVTTARNAELLAKLSLRQLLRLPADTPINLAPANENTFAGADLAETSAAELFASAIEKQPSIRAARLEEEAAALDIGVARAGYLPTVNLFGQLASNASTRSFAFPVQTDDTEFVEQNVQINGQDVTFGVEQPVFLTPPKPNYFDQLSNNFGQTVGLQLNVPIFSNGRNDAAVEQAQLAQKQARVSTEQARLRLEQDVQQAYQNAAGARAEVAAARIALDAAEAANDAAQRRSELGAGAAFDLTNSQLLLEQAQNAYLRARYQYLFNAKVVDFYLGRPLSLD